MEPTIQTVHLRLSHIERAFHTPWFSHFAMRLLTAAWEQGLLGDLPQADLLVIAKASRLHDLGKLVLPDAILDTPGPLSPAEQDSLRTHPEQGAAILDALIPHDSPCPPVLSYAREICLHHHERWVGDGYPDQLRGNAIPGYVQVISLVDCYDALRTERTYRPAVSHRDAKAQILAGDCGSFEASMLSCFARVVDCAAADFYDGRQGDG